jgi:hypothetical protein
MKTQGNNITTVILLVLWIYVVYRYCNRGVENGLLSKGVDSGAAPDVKMPKKSVFDTKDVEIAKDELAGALDKRAKLQSKIEANRKLEDIEAERQELMNPFNESTDLDRLEQLENERVEIEDLLNSSDMKKIEANGEARLKELNVDIEQKQKTLNSKLLEQSNFRLKVGGALALTSAATLAIFVGLLAEGEIGPGSKTKTVTQEITAEAIEEAIEDPETMEQFTEVMNKKLEEQGLEDSFWTRELKNLGLNGENWKVVTLYIGLGCGSLICAIVCLLFIKQIMKIVKSE